MGNYTRKIHDYTMMTRWFRFFFFHVCRIGIVYKQRRGMRVNIHTHPGVDIQHTSIILPIQCHNKNKNNAGRGAKTNRTEAHKHTHTHTHADTYARPFTSDPLGAILCIARFHCNGFCDITASIIGQLW